MDVASSRTQPRTPSPDIGKMDALVIKGGRPLNGRVAVSGAKRRLQPTK